MTISHTPEIIGTIGAPLLQAHGIYPTSGTGSYAGNALADVVGAWQTFIPSTATELYITGVSARAGDWDTNYADIYWGVGAAGAETQIAATFMFFDLPPAADFKPANHTPIWPWIYVPADVRLAIRLTLGKAASTIQLVAHTVRPDRLIAV